MFSPLIIVAIAVVVAFMPLKSNLFSANLSGVRTPEKFAGMFMDGAPDDALIITSYYNTYFCLLAYDFAEHASGGRIITNVYNWDHRWGRRQTSASLGLAGPESLRDGILEIGCQMVKQQH